MAAGGERCAGSSRCMGGSFRRRGSSLSAWSGRWLSASSRGRWRGSRCWPRWARWRAPLRRWFAAGGGHAAAVGRLPSAGVVLLFVLAGFFVPDLLLRAEVRRRREAIFLDLPEAIAVLALALRAGQSLRQALELAGRDTAGLLGEELQRALSLARRERGLGERQALVRVAREAGEPTFARFAELLAAKESPYLEFL